MPFNQRPLQHPHFIVPFTLDTDDTYEFVVRIQTKSSFQAPLSITTPEWFWQQDRVHALLEGGTYFICQIMAAYNFALFLLLRDRSYLFYVLYIVFFVMSLGANRGWGYEFIWPNYPDAQDFVVLLSLLGGISSAYAFAASFLRVAQYSHRLQRLFRGIIVLTLLFALPILILDQSVSARIVVVYSFLCTLMLGITSAVFWYRTRSRQAALYCISWLLLLMGAGLYFGNKLGLLPMSFLTEEGARIGAMLEIVFLSFALADRVNQDRITIEAAQQHVIELQQYMNVELEKQVKSRTQELENLNRMLHDASITDALTLTANRRHFDDTIRKEYQRAFRDNNVISLLMVDIDHFKKINDTFGHQAGDTSLQTVAQLLMESVRRPPDLAARYGGEEFSILLPNTTL